MNSTKIDPKFIGRSNPRVGLIALASDFMIEKDFINVIKDKKIDFFVNRIECYNPLTKENLIKMSNKVTDVRTDYYVDPKFNPVNQVAAGIPITSRTRLAPGISMAKFVSAHGDPVTLTHILDDSERLRLAKQYVLHADVLKLINSSSAPTQFKNFRLVPIEGLYRAESGENLDVSDGVNYLMSRGRTVVYELINNKGEMAVEKTFDLAVYFKDNLNYDKMILDYDNFNPDDSLNVQIIITMPEITPPFSVEYKNQFETRYNNITQATNELIEVLRTDEEPEELLT